MRIGLYVPCYNAATTLPQCLESVLAQTRAPDEVVVVDDGSTDDTAHIASSFPVRLVSHGTNRGLAAARNTALREISSDLLASVDADVCLDPGWLEAVLDPLSRDARIVAVGGRLVERYTFTVPDQWRALHLSQQIWEQGAGEVSFLPGCNMIVRRGVAREAGGYDTRLRTNYEDYDLSSRLTSLGKLHYSDAATAWHLRRDTPASLMLAYHRYFREWDRRRDVYADLGGLAQKLFAGRAEDRVPAPFPWRTGFSNINDHKDHLEVSSSARRVHLYYIDFLLLFAQGFLDLEVYHGLHPRSAAPSCLGHALWRVLQGHAGLAGSLGERIRHDLSGWRVPARGRPKAGARVKRIADEMVEVYWQLLDSYDDLAWKMANVSAHRVTVEETEEASYRGPRVALLNAPWSEEVGPRVRAGSRWPDVPISRKPRRVPVHVPFPFFLSHTSSLLKSHGIRTLLVDAIAEGLTDAEFHARVVGFDPDIVFLETTTPSVDADLRAAAELKRALPAAVLVVGGPHATALPTRVMKEEPAIDAVIRGEYEEAVLELAAALGRAAWPVRVPGVLYRDGATVSGSYVRRPPCDLTELPPPERVCLPIYNYNDPFMGNLQPNAQLMASRGCPYSCSFCLRPQVLYGSRRYRTFPVERVVDEMAHLAHEYGFRGLYFADDTFNVGTKRLTDLCRLIKERDLDVSWAIVARADTIEPELWRAMKDAGLVAVKLGVESADEQILHRAGKALDLERVRETTSLLKRLGVRVHLTFTLGLPGETADSIERTVALACELAPETVQFSVAIPFPGTQLSRQLRAKKHLVPGEYREYDGARHSVVKTDELSAADLQTALVRAYRVFHGSQAERALAGLVRRANEWVRTNRRVLVVGVNQLTRQVLTRIPQLVSLVVGFADPDPRRLGRKYLGLPVVDPIRAMQLEPHVVLLCTPGRADYFRRDYGRFWLSAEEVVSPEDAELLSVGSDGTPPEGPREVRRDA